MVVARGGGTNWGMEMGLVLMRSAAVEGKISAFWDGQARYLDRGIYASTPYLYFSFPVLPSSSEKNNPYCFGSLGLDCLVLPGPPDTG